MARQILKNQKRPQKKCPNCENVMIFTGSFAKHNPKIDGKDVCEDCYVAHLIEKYRSSL